MLSLWDKEFKIGLQVSGLWQDEDDRALLLRETDVPVTKSLIIICWLH